MAKKLANNKNLIIAEFDTKENDIIGKIEISHFPALKFYRGTDKEKSEGPFEYDGERSVEAIKEFIKEKAFHPISDGKIDL